MRVFAGVACALLAWPAVRAVASRVVWRVYPAFGAQLAMSLGAYAGAVAAAIVFLSSEVLAGVGAAAASGIVGVAWLSRTSARRATGLPPGSLWPLSVGLWTDPDFITRNARAHGPVFKTRQLVRPMVCIVDLPLGRRLLGEHDADLEAPPLPFNRFIPGGFLRWRDHESHAAYKRLFRDAFSRNVVAANEAELRAGIRRALSEIASTPAVEPRASINRMLFPLWTRLFLGVDDAARLKELSHILDVRRSHRLRRRRARRAVDEATEIVRTAPREHPSFLSSLPTDAVGDPAVAGSLLNLLFLTWADVSGLLCWIVRMLAANPETVARIRREPEFAEAAVRETLRLAQSEYLYRRARRDLAVDEFVIPRGGSPESAFGRRTATPRTLSRRQTSFRNASYGNATAATTIRRSERTGWRVSASTSRWTSRVGSRSSSRRTTCSSCGRARFSTAPGAIGGRARNCEWHSSRRGCNSQKYSFRSMVAQRAAL